MIPDAGILRILDANANRAREALRVLEDYARFGLDAPAATESLKRLRHDLAEALALLPMEEALLARNTPGDVGTGIKTPAELTRATPAAVLTANAKRLSEALRSMEESAKTFAPAAAAALERLRYRGYEAEQAVQKLVQQRSAVEKFRAVRVYVLMTEALCGPAEAPVPWDLQLESILEAAPASSGGGCPVCVQLREKGLEDADLLARAQLLVHKCRQFGALAIINDRPDIAILAGADGVHVGQTDLPCEEVRKVMGPGAVVGVSTERVEQARAAERAGATYVAAGPMFETATKEKPRIVGPAYAAEAVGAVGVPVVAIGGITPGNVGAVAAAGVERVAVSAAVLRAEDPGAVVRELLAALG